MWSFLKIDRLLTKSFTQNFKERYHHKRKESQVWNLKYFLPEESPKNKSAKDMSLYESFDFLKELSRLQKIDYKDGYFWLSLEEHFFCGLFPAVFFLRPRRKYTGKKTRRNSVNENSSKVCSNTSLEERWRNYAKRRQSQRYT